MLCLHISHYFDVKVKSFLCNYLTGNLAYYHLWMQNIYFFFFNVDRFPYKMLKMSLANYQHSFLQNFQILSMLFLSNIDSLTSYRKMGLLNSCTQNLRNLKFGN